MLGDAFGELRACSKSELFELLLRERETDDSGNGADDSPDLSLERGRVVKSHDLGAMGWDGMGCDG